MTVCYINQITNAHLQRMADCDQWEMDVENEAVDVLAELKAGQSIFALGHHWQYDDVLSAFMESDEFGVIVEQMKAATREDQRAIANTQYIDSLSDYEDKITFLIAAERLREREIDAAVYAAGY